MNLMVSRKQLDTKKNIAYDILSIKKNWITFRNGFQDISKKFTKWKLKIDVNLILWEISFKDLWK